MSKKSPKTRVDWVRARAEYVNSTKSAAEVAAQFGATPSAVSKRAAREDWIGERKKLSEKVAAEAQKGRTKDRVQELSDFNADGLIVAKALRNQVKAHLLESQTSKVAISAEKLRILASTAETSLRMGRVALGVNDKLVLGDDDEPPPESVKVTVVDASNADA